MRDDRKAALRMTADRLSRAALAGAALVVALVSYRTGRFLIELGRRQAEAATLWPVAVVVLLFVAVTVALLAALRLHRALRVNIGLALLAASVATYAVEAVLRLGAATEHPLRERQRVIEEVRARAPDAYPGISPAQIIRAAEIGGPTVLSVGDDKEVLPLGAISDRTTVDCREGDGPWMVYRTDEHGFHNPPGLWAQPFVSLAAVGDSFTHGACVPSDANILAHVRRRYAGALNLGISGSGPLIMLALTREYLPPLRPRVVLWCHYAGNDLFDLRKERTHPLLLRYLEDGFRQDLRTKQLGIDRALADYVGRYLTPTHERLARGRPGDLLALRRLRGRLGLLFADPYDMAPTEDEYGLFRTILAEAKGTVAQWGGRLVFVSLPPWRGLPTQLGQREHLRLQADGERRALEHARALGLQTIDVADALGTQPRPQALFSRAGGHYSPEGYRVAAEAILAALGPPEAH